MDKVPDFSTLSIDDAFNKLTGSETGLTKREAAKKLLQFGANELPETKKNQSSFFF